MENSSIITIEMEKYCPICLKYKLKAIIKPDTIIIKCQNPNCFIGGDPEKPPYLHIGVNYFPDWKQRGMDIYDLMFETHRRIFHRRVEDYWTKLCLNCGSSNVQIKRLGPWYNKVCMNCGYSSGGIPIEAWSIPEGIVFLRSHPKVRDGWVTKPLIINCKKCWAITCLDVENNIKLIIYADYKSFKPVKIVIDYEAKPLKHEKTVEELLREMAP
ncbi:MAG: hypothetical protein QXI93_04635 [Candidatus Methanomethylicia archaeon]